MKKSGNQKHLARPHPAKPDFAKRFGGKVPPPRPGKGAVDLLLEERESYGY